ncbi:MAG: VanZ family protein [Verrucomicrobiota bacterium]
MGSRWKYALAIGWTVSLLVISSLPGAITHELEGSIGHPAHADKVLHVIMFVVGSALWTWATGSPLRGFAIALAAGVAKEFYQELIPGRRFELADVLCDATGSVVGSLCTFFYVQKRRRPTPR